MRVRNRVTDANEAVIAIRRIREQVNDRLEKAQAAERDRGVKPMSVALARLGDRITAVEEAVYQVKNRSGQIR